MPRSAGGGSAESAAYRRAPRVLIVTAVASERDAVLDGLRAAAPVAGTDGAHSSTVEHRSDATASDATGDVIVGGVGPAAAAAATAAALARTSYDLVICAGIAGGFPPLQPGDVAIAAAVVFADLGAQTPGGFVLGAELGFGVNRYDVRPELAVALADRTGGHLGTVLTVATVTGTAESAARLVADHPDAVAEAMEGAGVAAAAELFGLPFLEIRAVSNLVGPRDRAAWRIPEALRALGGAIADARGAGLLS